MSLNTLTLNVHNMCVRDVDAPRTPTPTPPPSMVQPDRAVPASPVAWVPKEERKKRKRKDRSKGDHRAASCSQGTVRKQMLNR